MARRRRKASKKVEADAVEEVETSGDTEGDSSTVPEEESEESMEQSQDVAEPAQVSEDPQTAETNEVASETPKEVLAQQANTADSEQESIKTTESIAEQQSDALNDDIAQNSVSGIAEPISEALPAEETPQEEKSGEVGAEQMDVDNVVIDLEDKNEAKLDSTAEEEERSGSSVLRVEKEPSTAQCYDDDTCEVPVDPEADGFEEIIGTESPEFLKFWRAVLENTHDFTNWTYLLQLVEQENKPPLARRAYNGFFKHYPLCYGYWKKFSEMEKRNGNLVRAQRILERGVRAIPLSIDLWVHMIDFYLGFYKGPDAGEQKVRKVFERAIKASGREFRSEKLWNKYLEWEQENKNWKEVISIFDRVLRIPTQHYAIFFKEYKDFVMARSPNEILSVQEFEALLEEVRDEAEASTKTEEKGKSNPEMDDDAPPGVESDDRGKPPNEKELKSICEKVAAKRKKLFEETETMVTKIWTYEEGIKRPYFHVKALERTQIKNWRDYLEAEMGRGEDNARITLLFERCLIACALYEDFWLKYARFMTKVDPAAARKVFQRACEIHLPKKPNIHMHWATFEELQGSSQTAAVILEKLDKTLPNMAMIRMRRVAVERRAGNHQVAENLLKTYATGASKGSEECFWARKYAWFLVKISNNTELARKVLKDVIERSPDQVQLYKDLVGLEFMYGDEEHMVEACDLAINSQNLSEDHKYSFSQRKLEYLEDYGKDPHRVQKSYDEHQKIVRNHKKRTQNVAETISQPAMKKAKTESTTGNKIQSTNSNRYSAKATTNGTYSSPISSTLSAQPTAASTAAQIQATTVSQPQQNYQTAATGDASLYYQNYWASYQQKPATDVQQQQYNYNQWSQYSQQYYQQ